MPAISQKMLKHVFLIITSFFPLFLEAQSISDKKIGEPIYYLGKPNYHKSKKSDTLQVQLFNPKFFFEEDSKQRPTRIKTPRILHIATYGYNFSPDSSSLEKNYSRIQKIVSDSSALKKDSVEEGIKTAYEAMNLNLSEVDIVQLSLVDAVLFSNWEKGKEKIKETYKDQNLLIAVSEKDSWQRSEFMINFMQLHLQENDAEKAYLKVIKYITKKYGRNLEFKHYFHKKNK